MKVEGTIKYEIGFDGDQSYIKSTGDKGQMDLVGLNTAVEMLKKIGHLPGSTDKGDEWFDTMVTYLESLRESGLVSLKRYKENTN